MGEGVDSFRFIFVFIFAFEFIRFLFFLFSPHSVAKAKWRNNGGPFFWRFAPLSVDYYFF